MSMLMSARAFAEPLEINAANFPDAVFRAYVSEEFDIDGDDMLST
jgi:hypothetical protein